MIDWRMDSHMACGPGPSIIYDPKLEDWSRRITCGGGERQIIASMQWEGLFGKYILHVGIGNGDFERRIVGTAECHIDAITANLREKDALDSRALPRVRTFLADKASAETYRILSRRYDAIVDADLTCYPCCMRHFCETIVLMRMSLLVGGAIWTHEESLEERWDLQKNLGPERIPKMLPTDLDDLAKEYRFKIERIGRVIALRKVDE